MRVTVTAMELPPERPAGPDHRRRRGRGARARAAAPDRSEGSLMANVLAFAESRGGAAAQGRARGGDRGARARRRDRAARCTRSRRRAGNRGDAPSSSASTARTSCSSLEHAALANYNPEALAATGRRARSKQAAIARVVFRDVGAGRAISRRVSPRSSASPLVDRRRRRSRLQGDAIVVKHPGNIGKVDRDAYA